LIGFIHLHSGDVDIHTERVYKSTLDQQEREAIIRTTPLAAVVFRIRILYQSMVNRSGSLQALVRFNYSHRDGRLLVESHPALQLLHSSGGT
jgi:hypothetical protein